MASNGYRQPEHDDERQEDLYHRVESKWRAVRHLDLFSPGSCGGLGFRVGDSSFETYEGIRALALTSLAKRADPKP